MKRMRYLLFQWSRWPHDYLKQALGEECKVVFSKDYKQRVFRYLSGALLVTLKSGRGDTLVCWYDAQAVVTWWLCRILFLKRNVVCLNLLLKQKNTLKNKLASWMYKQALLADNFHATVTSREYGKWLNRSLGINVEFTLLHDVFHDYYEYPQLKESEKNIVFCGGCFGRDWTLMLDIVKDTPEVMFSLVMQNRDYYPLMRKVGKELPQNVIIEHNIPYKLFMQRLCQSKIVCMPLDSEAPQGLTVIFQAAANDKLILTSNNPTTVEYFSSEQLLGTDSKEWSLCIRKCLADEKKRKETAKEFHQFLKNECSEAVFAQTVKRIVESVEKVNG